MLVLGVVVVLRLVPAWLAIVDVVLSLLSAFSYRSDKVAAGHGARRTPESTLHLLDLLGGWPGGLVARHAFRHKTIKQPFRAWFWVTVAVNVAALVSLAWWTTST